MGLGVIGGPHYLFVDEGSNALKDIVPSVQAVTDSESIVDYGETLYRLHLINDGANTVYYAFDKTVVANNTFNKLESGESKIYDGEFKTAHFICASGETASLRLEAR